MRAVSGALATHLAGTAFVTADLYEFDVGGTTYRYTSCDRNLTGVSPAAAATYTSYVISRDRVRQSDGLEADDLNIIVHHGGTATIGSKTWVRASLDGDLDKAPVRLYRAFLDPASSYSVIGCTYLFSGSISKCDPSSTELQIVAAVPTKQMNLRLPQETCQPQCVWEFGSTSCGTTVTLNYTMTLLGTSSATVLRVSGPLDASIATTAADRPSRFVLGQATVSGYARTITDAASYGDGSPLGATLNVGEVAFRVAPPFPSGVISGGATITGRRGCAKTATVCDTWQGSNLAHFLGAPLAPASKDAA